MAKKPPAPGTMLKRGGVITIAGLAAGAGWLVLTEDFKGALVLGAVAGLGFITAARGYQVRHYE